MSSGSNTKHSVSTWSLPLVGWGFKVSHFQQQKAVKSITMASFHVSSTWFAPSRYFLPFWDNLFSLPSIINKLEFKNFLLRWIHIRRLLDLLSFLKERNERCLSKGIVLTCKSNLLQFMCWKRMRQDWTQKKWQNRHFSFWRKVAFMWVPQHWNWHCDGNFFSRCLVLFSARSTQFCWANFVTKNVKFCGWMHLLKRMLAKLRVIIENLEFVLNHQMFCGSELVYRYVNSAWRVVCSADEPCRGCGENRLITLPSAVPLFTGSVSSVCTD